MVDEEEEEDTDTWKLGSWVHEHQRNLIKKVKGEI